LEWELYLSLFPWEASRRSVFRRWALKMVVDEELRN
jgi:hypothetical protein